jgi:hypothetical protein
MSRLFSRSSAPQDHAPHQRSIPLVDVFATRGKHVRSLTVDINRGADFVSQRTANRHTVKRDKLLQQQRPPRKWQAHAGASSSNTPPAGTSNDVVGGATPTMLQTGSISASAATNRPPSPSDVGHGPDTTCFAVLTSCFPRAARTPKTSPSASGSR